MTIVFYDKWENGKHIMATAYNDITGENLVSRGLTKEGEASFERIFGVKERKQWIPPALPLNDYPDNSKDEWDETRVDIIGQNGNVGYDSDNL